MTAGTESMKPVQLSQLGAALAAAVANVRKSASGAAVYLRACTGFKRGSMELPEREMQKRGSGDIVIGPRGKASSLATCCAYTPANSAQLVLNRCVRCEPATDPTNGPAVPAGHVLNCFPAAFS
jgi:hypothetical protein